MSEQATQSNPTDLTSKTRSVRSLLPAPLRKWSRKRWIVVGSVVAAIAIIAAGTRTWERVPEGSVYAERLVEEINLAREDQGVGDLGIDERLTAAAVAAAEEYQYMGAITAQADTSACAPGAEEIVTRSLKDAYTVVDRWLGLARWGDLLTDPDAQSVGAGCVRGGTEWQPQVVCSVLISTSAPQSSAPQSSAP